MQYVTVDGQRLTLAQFVAMDKSAAITVYAGGCTGLTTLDLPAATWVYAGGCAGSPVIFHAGTDSRDYSFAGLRTAQGLRVAAGCRYFDLATARAHWGVGGPSDRADCRALVEMIAAWGQS